MDRSHPSDPVVGSTIDGRWHVLRQIGTGAVGAVYLAERAKLGRQVALKLLHPEYLSNNEYVSRFAREARALSRLQHINCVSILDVGTHEHRPYIVMELVNGPALSEEIGTPEMTVVRAVKLVRQVLEGLGHAHGHGIIHRDLKPDNIIVTEVAGVGEVAKILDFGFAHINDSRLSQSNARLVPGTPSYMAPEQARGEKADQRTDLYAVGVLLYELCTTFKPFVAPDAATMLQKHQFEAPIPAKQAALGRRMSDGLDRVISRALEKDRDKRFADAAAFAAALEATPEGREAGGSAGSRKLLPWAIAVALLVLASIGVIAALHAR
jgi:serine/threonine protein kinase